MGAALARNRRLVAAAAALAALALPALAQDAAEIARGTGIEAGLVVHVGSTDGRLEAELAKGGRRLVHGLALDDRARDAARTAIADAGLYGLAWVETAATLPRLPYADNLVNLLVADADALGRNAPGSEEMARVVAPRGAMYLKQGGKWTKSVKPMPAEMDEWTHWDHGPDGNPVSRDSLVKPTNSLRWQSTATPWTPRASRRRSRSGRWAIP